MTMNRLTLLAITCFLLLTPRYGIAEKSLADCAAIKNAGARLACFDKLAGAGARSDTVPVVAPAIPAASTQATPPAPVASAEAARLAELVRIAGERDRLQPGILGAQEA